MFESNISAIYQFKNNLAISAMMQYASPKPDILNQSFQDMIYAASIDKTFNNKLKIGCSVALPFITKYKYRSNYSSANNFDYRSEGFVHLSGALFTLKASCSFTSGKKVNKLNRDKDEITNGAEDGF